jgi:NADPH:quinone reductase-like Zn-dependent oxidoreductase
MADNMKYAAPTTCCACCNNYAREGALVWKEKQIPKVTGSNVLIQVKAVAMNPIDWKRSRGAAGQIMSPNPMCDLSGVVIAKGPSATGSLKVGDPVVTCIYPRQGALAEYVLAAEKAVGPKPVDWDHSQAAALGMGAATASSVLRLCCAGPGKKFVVLGASGAVGQMILVLARPTGASILAVASKPKHEACKALGGPNVKVCDYKTEDWTSMCEGRPDVIVDVTSLSPLWSFHKAISVRAKRYITVNALFPSFQTVGNPCGMSIEAAWCLYAQTCATLGCCGLCGPCYCCACLDTGNLGNVLRTISQQAEEGELPSNPLQVQIFAPEQVHMAYDLAQTTPGSKAVIDMTKLK